MPLAAAQVGLSLIDRRPCTYLSQLAQERGFSLLASGTLVRSLSSGGGGGACGARMAEKHDEQPVTESLSETPSPCMTFGKQVEAGSLGWSACIKWLRS